MMHVIEGNMDASNESWDAAHNCAASWYSSSSLWSKQVIYLKSISNHYDICLLCVFVCD